MKVTKPTTEAIDLNHRLYVELKKVRIGGLFVRPNVADAILLAKTIAQTQAELWQAVRKAYPESAGKNVSVSNYELSWDEDDVTPNPS